MEPSSWCWPQSLPELPGATRDGTRSEPLPFPTRPGTRRGLPWAHREAHGHPLLKDALSHLPPLLRGNLCEVSACLLQFAPTDATAILIYFKFLDGLGKIWQFLALLSAELPSATIRA